MTPCQAIWSTRIPHPHISGGPSPLQKATSLSFSLIFFPPPPVLLSSFPPSFHQFTQSLTSSLIPLLTLPSGGWKGSSLSNQLIDRWKPSRNSSRGSPVRGLPTPELAACLALLRDELFWGALRPLVVIYAKSHRHNNHIHTGEDRWLEDFS